jgi:hypothetical protein
MNQRHNVNMSNYIDIFGVSGTDIGNRARLGASLFRFMYARFIYPPLSVYKR